MEILLRECNQETQFNAHKFRYWMQLHCITYSKDMQFHILKYCRNLGLLYYSKNNYRWTYKIKPSSMEYWLKKHPIQQKQQ